MSMTSTDFSTSTTSISDTIVRHLKQAESWVDDSYVMCFHFEIPGIKQYEVNVKFDTFNGVLKVNAEGRDKRFEFEEDVFERISKHHALKRWNRKVNLMPLELEDGILTVKIKCGLWAIERGRFEDK